MSGAGYCCERCAWLESQRRPDIDALAQRLAWHHGCDAATVLAQLEDALAEARDAEEHDTLLAGMAAMARDLDAAELAQCLDSAPIDADITF